MRRGAEGGQVDWCSRGAGTVVLLAAVCVWAPELGVLLLGHLDHGVRPW